MLLKRNYIYIIFYISILLSFYFNEDALGGSENDYKFHLQFIELFGDNLLNGLLVYGYEGYPARNSPTFYIILSFINKFINLEQIRFLNTISALVLSILFYKTLKLNFENIDRNKLKVLSCIIFLSPTVRSIAIWPYPILWSNIFFLLSIYFFLLLKKNNNSKDIYFCFSSLIFASYLNYTFCVFAFYYLLQILKTKNINYSKINLFLFLFCCSIPAILFLFFRDGIHVIGLADGFSLSIYDTLNFSNKILIISSIIFLYLLPFLKLQDFYIEFKNINYKKKIIFIIIFSFLVFLFDYPYTNYFGGGIFFKISNLIFGNNILFYLISLISLYIIFKINKDISQITLILILLFLYNLQFTIYMKYYDPLLIFVIIFLLDQKIIKRFFEKKFFLEKIYSFFILVYFLFLIRNNINFL